MYDHGPPTVRRGQVVAMSVAAGVNVVCAALFWTLLATGGGSTFFSFWNRPFASRIGLTIAFVLIGSRVLVWYARKVWGYRTQKGRSLLRIGPLGFGLGVFSMTISWLAVTLLYSSLARSFRLIQGQEQLDVTVVLVPFAFFLQFLFSHSTLIWLLAGGVVWLAAVYVPAIRTRLIGFKVTPQRPDPVAVTGLAFVKTWNVFGYLILILSLMFQG